MTCGELFAGIGGIGLGLERAGMEVRWQVERDPYCRRVLAKHWPDVKRYEDVEDVGAHNLEPVDLISGGFPCQPVSVAGKRKAQDDERWLWPEFARIIRELRPGYVLVENVPGILVRGFGDVLGDLAALGYDAEWGCVSAASVGAPHLRWRAFIVAHTDGAWELQSQGAVADQRRRPSDGSGPSGNMAHTPGPRRHEGERGEGGPIRDEARRSQPQRRGSEVADPDGKVGDTTRPAGEAVHGPETVERSRRCGGASRGQWTTLARFCRMVDGFSSLPHGDQP